MFLKHEFFLQMTKLDESYCSSGNSRCASQFVVCNTVTLHWSLILLSHIYYLLQHRVFFNTTIRIRIKKVISLHCCKLIWVNFETNTFKVTKWFWAPSRLFMRVINCYPFDVIHVGLWCRLYGIVYKTVI